jgi:hypothetical protein
LEQWKADGDLTELSDRETRRFESTFHDRLAHKRYVLLMKNHIERLAVILTGIGDWVSLNREVLAKDADSAAEILKKIRNHQQRFKQIKLAIKKTLGGAIPEIKKELHQEVHRFFDAQAGIIAKDIRNFIRAFSISPEKYQKSLETADFSQTLNAVFLEFKQSIDAHIAEAVNPEVLRFVQAGEKQIKQYFEGLIIPFSNMIEDAHQEFDGMLGRNEGDSDKKSRSRSNPPQMDTIIESSELDPPPLVATMHYSTKIKTEAIMRLGFYRVFRNVTALFKKSAYQKGEDALKALQNSVQQMKRETEKSVVFHIKDYRENLKFRFLYKMVDATAVGFAQAVLDRFQAYYSNLSTAIEHIGTSQQDKAKAMQVLNEMDRVLKELEARINRVRIETGQVS